jgi:cytochrome b561
LVFQPKFQEGTMKEGYTLAQILLHWLIAALLPIQYLTGGSIERTHHAVHMGVLPDPWDILQHQIHNYSGMTIGALMAARLCIRLFFSPPRPPVTTTLERIARLLHLGFYAAIIAQAGMGFIASFIWFGIAPIHVIGAWTILVMFALHVAAAAWHTLIKKDEILDRMIRPQSARLDNTQARER